MSRMTRRAALQSGAALAALAPMAGACAQIGAEETPTSRTAAATGGTQWQDGVEIAERIKRGETSAAEQVNAAIARAEAINPKINAIVTPTYAQARARAASGVEGRFAGVASFNKDLYDRAGVETLYGSRAFRGNVAEENDPLVQAWREAGIVSLGKSSTPERGLISSNEPLVTGPTRNPWDLERIPGGSSGGAAALVAARIVPFANASDGGGSIRIPASCCGLFGLKPSRGRLVPADRRSLPVELSVGHAVTLSVRDSLAIFRATQRQSGDAQPLRAVGAAPAKRLRIAFAPEPPAGGALDGDVRAALEDTAELCRTLGHEVRDYSLPFDGREFEDRFLLYWAAGAAGFADQAAAFSGKPVSPDIVEPWTLGLRDAFLARQDEMPATIDYLKAFEARYHAMFEGFDILLSPTVARPPDPIGVQDPAGDFETVMERVTSFAAYTAPMNVAGAPSMSVPLSCSQSGLPTGSMFSARKGDDALLFELARELEVARPWIDRLPPVHA